MPMRLRRAFCRLCECPVVDGGVRAAEVDKEKFSEWCLDVMDENLASKLKRGDVICNFCVWDAEMLLQEHADDDFGRVKWWPNLRNSELQEKKRNYIVGKVQSCCEKVSLPENDKDEENGRSMEQNISTRKTCFYCGQQFSCSHLPTHMKKKHKDVLIRCDVPRCPTFFLKFDEKETHMKQFHEIPREHKFFECIYCGKRFASGARYLRKHIQTVHSAVAIGCNAIRCVSYFKTQAELESHFELRHKEASKAKFFNCGHCQYKTNISKSILRFHIMYNHIEKTISCSRCDVKFSCELLLKRHIKLAHVFKVCKFCKLGNIPVQFYWSHFKKTFCRECNQKFGCVGLMQKHYKTCKETVYTCEKCQKTFKRKYLFEYHMRAGHGKDKNLRFRCKFCRKYLSSLSALQTHLKRYHDGKDTKFSCAHCPKKYFNLDALESHLAVEHNLIEKKYECKQCKMRFFPKSRLKLHLKVVHVEKKKCRLCGTLLKYLDTHMLRIHGVSKYNFAA